MLSRRGFLGTLAAAATGAAAVFDPIAKLWVSEAIASGTPGLAFRPDAFEVIGRSFDVHPVSAHVAESASALQRVIDTQLELNNLALRLAKEMTARLEHHKSVLLRQVVYELSGQNHLNGLIRMPPPVERLGPQGSAEFLEKLYPGISNIPEAVGQFVPSQHRVLATLPAQSYSSTFVNRLAGALTGKVSGFDMFVPITGELRPGEPFTDDVAVGVATDPESGLTVRVLSFIHEGPRSEQPLIGAEMVGGEWEPVDRDPKRIGIRLRQKWDITSKEIIRRGH